MSNEGIRVCPKCGATMTCTNVSEDGIIWWCRCCSYVIDPSKQNYVYSSSSIPYHHKNYRVSGYNTYE